MEAIIYFILMFGTPIFIALALGPSHLKPKKLTVEEKAEREKQKAQLDKMMREYAEMAAKEYSKRIKK